MQPTNPSPPRRRLDVLGLALLLALAAALGLWWHSSRTLDWPAAGLAVLPGTPEETVDGFLEAIARDDMESAAKLLTARYGSMDGPELAKQLSDSLRQAGGLTRWLLVSRQDGDPVLLTVYAHFARAGEMVMTAEVFSDAAGWRMGNLRTGDGTNPRWRPPTWETANTPRLRFHAWPGLAVRDLTMLLERGEEAFGLALGPFRGADQGVLALMSEQVDVFIYDSGISLSAAVGEALPDWVVGTWRGGAVHLITQGPNTREGQPLLFEYLTHELNHAILSRYLQVRALKLVAVPAWLPEGMAGLAARQLSGARRAGFASEAARAQPPALTDLARTFTHNQVQYRYEYSFAFCEYLCGRFGAETLRHLVDAICEGATPSTALELATGQEMATLTASWHAWLQGGLVWTTP
ncbi:MAG: peptidase MA family metallohydrolase [Bacillota bacterium]|nr:peptidase MA family metallohydrolase [Bacillota bacterium]